MPSLMHYASDAPLPSPPEASFIPSKSSADAVGLGFLRHFLSHTLSIIDRYFLLVTPKDPLPMQCAIIAADVYA